MTLTGRRSVLVYAGAVCALAAGLAWVTVHALRLERAEREVRAASRHQESLRLALWRMDAAITPIIAREAARPYYEYQAFYAPGQQTLGPIEQVHANEVLVASPLLQSPDAVVRLNFQRLGDGEVTSPQVPGGVHRVIAEPTFITGYQLAETQSVLESLRRSLSVPLIGRPGEPTADATTGADVVMEQTADKAVPTDTIAQQTQADQSAREYQARQSVVNDAARNLAQSRGRKEESDTALKQAPGLTSRTASSTQAASAPPPAPAPAAVAPGSPANEPAPAAAADAQLRAAGSLTGSAPANPAGSPSENPTQNPTSKVESGQGDYRVELERAKKASMEKEDAAMDSDRGQPKKDAAVGAGLGLPNGYTVSTVAPPELEQGPFVAKWISRTGEEPQLVFEREVRLREEQGTQGFLIDWGVLRQTLLTGVADLFPKAELRPLLNGVGRETDPAVLGRSLAVIPAELVVEAPVAGAPTVWTPLRATLALAWVGMLVAVVVIGLALRAATELAERRGQFVSAVTHELRTPLTTFVMYSQMLADGMIQGEEARNTYLATLKTESQRLARIVESVLEYARLSKRKHAGVRTRLSAEHLVESLRPVLEGRCAQAGMQLVVEREGDVTVPVETDPATLERILYNLVDNACKYAGGGEDKRVHLCVQASGRDVVLSVRDHGPGVPPTEAAAVFRPFTRGKSQADGSMPGLGLGLSLSQSLARELGGDLRLVPATPGAEFRVRLPRA